MTAPTQHPQPETPGRSPFSRACDPSMAPIQAQPCPARRKPDSTVDVGQLTPAELDAFIARLGHLMVRAKRLGDDDNARRLCELQKQARAARSPEHVARQDAEHLQRVEEGVAFFDSEIAQQIGRRAMGGRR